MSPKFTKAITANLIRYVSTVDVRFNPFDRRTRSARELLRQISSERFQKSHPKLKIATHILSTVDPPAVQFKFVDGTEKAFDSEEYLVNEMMGEVFMMAEQLDNEYEMEGKSLD
uniref:Large ribosomal subunit protein mL53 n=1 Tax=Eucampia antarctica TaxID=49252 RepID=A0A7S2REZ9_9STRA|mmetsp:Transcript_21349/g.20509  ORF Transcript_21349/g.20509 Transcript_21349/m.20509 type:complete len:114 (+) Transcript_21349:97-438(+)